MLIYNIIQYKILSTVSFENEKLIDNSSQKTLSKNGINLKIFYH